MDDSFFCYDHHRSRRFRFVMNDVYLSAACLLTRLSTAQSTVGTVGQREREIIKVAVATYCSKRLQSVNNNECLLQ